MPQKIIKGIGVLLAEANGGVDAVTAAQAMELHARDDHVFIDLRDPRELKREGRIPDAFSCPRGMLEFWIDPESPYHKAIFAQDKTFVFYCASGWRSALAAKTASEMGLSPVVHVEGGLTAWKAAGAPVEEI
ncbi:MAG: rhodanese-like domain-containing protein [Alphaproteobacteria bacterium]